MTEYIYGKHFACDCGEPQHALYVGPFSGDEFDNAELAGEIVTFTLVLERQGLWARLKSAAGVLRGRYELHEIVIDRDQWPAFVGHINEIDAACKRVQAAYREKKS
jgi:hypothetical protein